ncbi:unnamed protein product [Aureobasidium vineae]|uniref:Methyltransferase domain-containing protein n=1 Tax=Aureobasidium vineae TaxID=2773715 RepID=A0A9N8P7F7_9PEZI|nr:unnamed protein product [Aureobasidium vineae]
MPSSTPSFGEVEYWNTRFTKEEQFDWLADFAVLEPWLKKAITEKSGHDERPQVLHIGCGSSALSTQLRDLVDSPQQIHNVDYSSVVIERNRQRESEMLRTMASEIEPCRWSTLDLLSASQILDVENFGDEYDVIIDKSTSDAISCAEDVAVDLPYCINTTNTNRSPAQKQEMIYPLHILAIHLAYLARPNCLWIVLSYSSSRFSSWEDATPPGSPKLDQIWEMHRHEKIEQPPDPEDNVHRPPTMHHLYILKRTDVVLNRVI